jgi:hypothetical protein
MKDKETKKIFTLREANELLPQVREFTVQAVKRAERLQAKIEIAPQGARKTQLEAEYNAMIRAWAEQMVDMGCEVKGLWLVDFDSGDGIYYCWRHPEEKLEYFHDYDSGFAGRRPLGRLAVL